MAAGFVLGEVLARAISMGAAAAAGAVLAVLFAVWKDKTFRIFPERNRLRNFLTGGKRMAVSVLFAAAFLTGAVRLCSAEIPSAKMRELDAVIQDGGSSRDRSLRIESMEEKGNHLVIRSGTLLVYVPKDSLDGVYSGKTAVFSEDRMPKIGNIVHLSGKLSRMEPASNPGQFDFANYYKARGITHSYYASAIRVTDSKTDIIPQKIFEFRCALENTLDRICEPEDASFLKAALLGDRSSMEEDTYDLYRKNGIAHLLAISGLHMAILGLGLYHLLRKTGLNFLISGMISGALLLFYSMLTGTSTSITRSVAMLLLFFFAAAAGRTYDLLSAASFAAVLILLAFPLELFQCGFQLSFLAVFSIGGPAKILIRKYRIRNPVRQSFYVSLTVSLISLPVVAFWFFSVPVLGVLLNLIVIPLMTYVVWSGIAVLFLSGVNFFAACTAAGVTHTILQFYLFLCQAVSRIPLSRILTGRPHLLQIALYYLFLFLAFRVLTGKEKAGKERGREEQDRGEWDGEEQDRGERGGKKHGIKRQEEADRGREEKNREEKSGEEWIGEHRSGSTCREERKQKRKRIMKAVLLSAAAIVSVLHIPSYNTRISFLDIGQGDCIVLQKGFRTVLIDGGSSSNKKAGEYILKPFLEYHAVKTVETVYLTHADSDHTNAVEYLLGSDPDREIKTVVLSAPAKTDEKYDKLKKEIAGKGCSLEYIGAGDEIPDLFGNAFFGILPAGPAKMLCLSPRKDLVTTETNEESLVLLFEEGKFSCLFTGDAGKPSEDIILKEVQKDAALKKRLSGIEVLKVGHHGSRNSSGEDFLKLLEPGISVLSYGIGNRYNHPNGETVEKLEKLQTEILHTAKDGCISIVTDGKGMRAETYLSP